MSYQNYKKAVELIEKNSNILSEASGGNSGILHTGYDCDENTLEGKIVKRSY